MNPHNVLKINFAIFYDLFLLFFCCYQTPTTTNCFWRARKKIIENYYSIFFSWFVSLKRNKWKSLLSLLVFYSSKYVHFKKSVFENGRVSETRVVVVAISHRNRFYFVLFSDSAKQQPN